MPGQKLLLICDSNEGCLLGCCSMYCKSCNLSVTAPMVYAGTAGVFVILCFFSSKRPPSLFRRFVTTPLTWNKITWILFSFHYSLSSIYWKWCLHTVLPFLALSFPTLAMWIGSKAVDLPLLFCKFFFLCWHGVGVIFGTIYLHTIGSPLLSVAFLVSDEDTPVRPYLLKAGIHDTCMHPTISSTVQYQERALLYHPV